MSPEKGDFFEVMPLTIATLGHNPSIATGNVFLCVARQRDIGEVASLRAEWVDPQLQSGFSANLKVEKFVKRRR